MALGNKRRDLGLGWCPAVTLAKALEVAREKRQSILQGRDPVTRPSDHGVVSPHASTSPKATDYSHTQLPAVTAAKPVDRLLRDSAATSARRYHDSPRIG